MGVSVLILTKDEAVNLPACLQSLRWCDDVVVLDSFSSDTTCTLAREGGARVVQRAFDDYASQRNFGMNEIPFRHPWLLMLDADECVPEDLRDELLEAARSAPADVSLYLMRRRDHLFGRWIRRSSGYPTWFGRLLRIGRTRADRPYNEIIVTADRSLRLHHHIDHYPFNKGFHEWIVKHDRYSSMEAALLHARRTERLRVLDLLSSEAQRRRTAHKAILYSLPFRPTIAFLGLYVLRGGCLEGRAGLTFCLLRAWYEFMIDCKLRELQRRAAGMPI